MVCRWKYAISAAAQERTVLPIPRPPSAGTIADEAVDATPAPVTPAQVPVGAANVVIFMSDDTGFHVEHVRRPGCDTGLRAAGGNGAAEVVLSSGARELARGKLPTSVLAPSGNTEPLDVAHGIAVTVTDYRTPHGAIEGDIPHVSTDLD